MMWVWSVVCVVASALLTSASYLPASEGGPIGVPDVLLREMVARMGSGLAHPPDSFLPLSAHRLEEEEEEVEMKKLRESSLPLEYDELALSPSLRDQEYLAHSTLLGSVLGNYEEKMKQHAKPLEGEGTDSMGSSSNSDVEGSSSSSTSSTSSSTEGVLPAYCNPPNPCPIGYTGEDGCLEVFENTAAFSRDYQALQDCMCDTEHMFECDDSSQDSEITALARSIQNEGVLDSTLDKIMSGLTETDDQRHRMVMKKFHQKKSVNPYLLGEKLPVAAKKGGRM